MVEVNFDFMYVFITKVHQVAFEILIIFLNIFTFFIQPVLF